MSRRILLPLLLLLGLAVCAGCAPAAAENDGRLDIVALNFPAYDFARAVCGTAADTEMLMKPGVESHAFDPTPQDMKRIREAGLFIYTGGENDVWVEELLAALGADAPPTLCMLDCVETLNEETVAGMQLRGEPEEAAADEHVWTSPRRALGIVQAIAAAVSGLDPAHATEYADNAAAYEEQLRSLDADFRAAVAAGSRQTLVFGDRFPFLYFARDYGLDYYAAFPGCAADVEPSAATVAGLIDRVRAQQIPVVFVIEFSNCRIADAICEATGARRLLFHSCHNVTAEELAAGVSYLSLMRQNLENLRLALN